MKKIVVRILAVLVVLLVIAVVAVGMLIDKAIKRGVETFGPKFTKVSVKLDSVSLSVLSGSGTIKGLVVGNPQGYKTPSAINIGEASIALKPGSLLSDKIVVKSIRVHAPEITYETNFKKSNLTKIRDNLQETTGGGQKGPAKPQEPSAPKEAKPPKKLQVDEFIITGGKIKLGLTALGGEAATLPLPDIELRDLGTGPEGITAAELTDKIVAAIDRGASQVSCGSVMDIGKGVIGAGSNAVDSVTRSLGNLFKGK